MRIFDPWLLLRRLPASRRLWSSGVFLKQQESRATGYTSAARREDLVGKEGIALTDLRPSGTGLFGEERIDVVSESQWVERGSSIRIIASEGYRQVVRLVGTAESS